jgi:peptide/nickel transport system substrate-binding protein
MILTTAWLALLAVILGVGVVPAPAAAQPAGTLVVGLVAEPVNLDPAQVTDLNSNRVGRRIVETLVTFPDESTQVVAGLAESWTVAKDGLRYTFKLRKGISFHDGTPLNAEAVKFSIERQIDPAHPFNKLGKYPFANYFFGNVKAVEVVDPLTVEFVLKEPRASFLAVLTAGAASVVSPTAVKKFGADYALTPVGTGPFKYVSWDRGQRVVLEKNPSYWKFPVKVDRVIYRPIVEDQARLTELMTGTLDLMVGTPPDFVAQLEKNPNVTLLRQVGAHVWYLGINNQKKPFADKRVRQAMNYAVNKEAIVRDVLKGTGSMSAGPVLPGTWGADAGLKPYPYAPARARKLLAEAGFPNGLDTEIFAYRERNQTEAIISNLQAAGIRAKLTFSQYAAMRDSIRAGKASLTHQTWGSFSVNDVSASTPVWFAFEADDITRDPKVRDLLIKGNNSVDPNVRKDAYREAHKLIADNAYSVPLWSLPVYYVATRDLNFEAYPDEMVRFWEMTWK